MNLIRQSANIALIVITLVVVIATPLALLDVLVGETFGGGPEHYSYHWYVLTPLGSIIIIWVTILLARWTRSAVAHWHDFVMSSRAIAEPSRRGQTSHELERDR
jgi:hypothetical protein